MKDKLKELMDMEIGEVLAKDSLCILRVPGGWIYSLNLILKGSEVNQIINSVFVPEPKVEKKYKPERSVNRWDPEKYPMPYFDEDPLQYFPKIRKQRSVQG